MTQPVSSNDLNLVEIFIGDEKYIAGILLTLANIIGFVSHFRKRRVHYVQIYSLLALVIVTGALLARL